MFLTASFVKKGHYKSRVHFKSKSTDNDSIFERRTLTKSFANREWK